MMRRTGTDSNVARGNRAEQLAAEFLMSKGYAIRERNWRPSPAHFEVDIIAQKDADIVFVEVKARTDTSVDPADAVDARKQRNISRAADIYLRRLPHLHYYRFDIIAVSGEGDKTEITHIEDAFMSPLTGVGVKT